VPEAFSCWSAETLYSTSPAGGNPPPIFLKLRHHSQRPKFVERPWNPLFDAALVEKLMPGAACQFRFQSKRTAAFEMCDDFSKRYCDFGYRATFWKFRSVSHDEPMRCARLCCERLHGSKQIFPRFA
jgi:hypothetical protein